MTHPTLTADEYLAAFRQRRECCRALLELSREQQRLIDAADYSELIELLQVKQRLVDELVGPPSAPWKSWKNDQSGLPATARTTGDSLLEETEQLLQSLLAEEQVGTNILIQRRDASERELSQMNSSLQIDSAYRPAPLVGSRLGLDIDL